MINHINNSTVAIIGNAKSLFDKRYGPIIDSYNIICRINNGCSIIEPQSQGLNTNFAFFNSAARHYNLIHKLNKSIQIFHVSNKNRHKNKNIKLSINYVPIESNKEIAKLAKTDKPSSGLMIIHYMMNFSPKKLSLFGFDFKKTPSYYTNNKGPHDFLKEKEYVLNLINNNENLMIYN